MSVLAGTSLAGERRHWWITASLVAVAGAVVNLWLPALLGSNAESGPRSSQTEPIAAVLVFAYFPCITLAVAWAGRIGHSNGWPGIVRVLVCLATDFTVRWGTTIGFFLLWCNYSVYCDP